MADWPAGGLEDDMRPRMFEAASAGQAFALATIVDADGGPRPVGSQMVITADRAWGFLSGGCIEADVALHGRAMLADGTPRTLVYGRGSPFIDMRLPCGGRLELLVERVTPDDAALDRLRRLTERRVPARWQSDGQARRCTDVLKGAPDGDAMVDRIFFPYQRLVVVGSDPFALATADLGGRLGWQTLLIARFGPAGPPPADVACDRRPLADALASLAPDPWTAIAIATHDVELDEEALLLALRSAAGYVGVLGSRRRLPERKARLRQAGLSSADIARLKAPIGLPIRARSPWEVAVAVTAEIISEANRTHAAQAETEGNVAVRA
ncbi:XdhC family protein [Sphingosinicella sp. BN140058]|uniref:XdhC family protein n=1 Tax=Sphingosinicella sp. BN140058 TaxID=1892855 RepID=UPI0010126DF4|nr:XdhC family protein [Sphingosinicella sp. BN140058]QAY79435.1 XdhC family protein [Sphingosinicella sp. BN140058]